MADIPGDTPPVDLYWRPGCGFCVRLMRQLDRVGLPTTRHDIWDDPAAAEVVRSAANGNETVPTVIVGSMTMVNPSFEAVLAAVGVEAPSLLPDGVDPTDPPRGRVAGTLNRLLGG